MSRATLDREKMRNRAHYIFGLDTMENNTVQYDIISTSNSFDLFWCDIDEEDAELGVYISDTVIGFAYNLDLQMFGTMRAVLKDVSDEQLRKFFTKYSKVMIKLYERNTLRDVYIFHVKYRYHGPELFWSRSLMANYVQFDMLSIEREAINFVAGQPIDPYP